MSENTKTELTPEDEFDQAFDEITKADQVPADNLQGGNEVPPESGVPGETNNTTVTESVVEPVPAQGIDYQNLYEKELQRTKSWEGRIRAANQRAEEAEQKLIKELQARPAPAKEPVIPPSAADESVLADDDELKEFFEEYPELVSPFNKLVDRKGEKIARRIVQEELQKITPKIDVLETKYKEDVDNKHFKVIAEAHPDWETYVENGELTNWIEAQPALVQKELNRVMTAGSTREAIELLTMFKSNKSQKNTNTTTPNKKADDLAAVPASTGGPPIATPNSADYDAAWEEANRKRK